MTARGNNGVAHSATVKGVLMACWSSALTMPERYRGGVLFQLIQIGKAGETFFLSCANPKTGKLVDSVSVFAAQCCGTNAVRLEGFSFFFFDILCLYFHDF